MLALPVSRYRLKERFEIFYHRNSALSMKDGLSFYMFLKNDFARAHPPMRAAKIPLEKDCFCGCRMIY